MAIFDSKNRFWISAPFWTLALGLFLTSYIYGIASVAIAWVPRHGVTTLLLLAWSPFWLAFGIMSGGVVADIVGRRRVLLTAPLVYLIGGTIILISPSLVAVLLGSLLLIVATGVDSNTLLTYGQELVPLAIRQKAMYTELNFVNLGSLTLAGLSYVGGILSTTAMRQGLALVPMALVLVTYVVRLHIPESPLWRQSHRAKNRHRQLKMSGLPLRFFVSSAFSFSNTAGFSLLTYAFGAEILPRHFRQFLIVSTATAFLVGLSGRYLSRFPAKLILLISYGAAFFAALGLFYVHNPPHPGFWVILLVLSGSTSISYIAEDTFKSSRWPSIYRARLTGAVRVTGLVGYIGVLLITRSFPHPYFLLINAGVWFVGFFAAIVWWRYGKIATS